MNTTDLDKMIDKLPDYLLSHSRVVFSMREDEFKYLGDSYKNIPIVRTNFVPEGKCYLGLNPFVSCKKTTV